MGTHLKAMESISQIIEDVANLRREMNLMMDTQPTD